MLLLSKPTPRCAECDAPSKIQALFTREVYCGRYCLTEGQLEFVRWGLRENAEGQHVGQEVPMVRRQVWDRAAITLPYWRFPRTMSPQKPIFLGAQKNPSETYFP